MPPRAPVVWTTTNTTRSERVRRRLDERHQDLTREASAVGARYRRSRATKTSAEGMRLRADFLAALGRLSAFESASLSLSRCKFEVQVSAYADDLARDYFELWGMLARRGSEPEDSDVSAERLDHFAVQLGRLEGLADALLIAGRNVRLFPPPHINWMPLATT